MSYAAANERDYERGNELAAEGRIVDALAAWQAAARALTCHDDALAIDLYENLGIALWQLGRWRAASRALLRALDGDPAREQARRLIVSCAFRDGRMVDGERLLRAYEARFGPHPERWTRSP
jgi:tetratricopeptide (TPR) repeat protein